MQAQIQVETVGSPAQRRSQAFTLVELLVVIAIIALLMSILLPSLSQAREMARQIKCSASMKQLGQGNSFYRNDWDALNVPYTTPAPGGKPSWNPHGNYVMWYHNSDLREHMGAQLRAWYGWNREMLCPNTTWPLAEQNNPGNGAGYRLHYTYGYNIQQRDGSWGDRGRQVLGLHQGDVYGPADKIFFSDSLSWAIRRDGAVPGSRFYFVVGGEPPVSDPHPLANGNRLLSVAYRHLTDYTAQRGNANVLYFDGHVQSNTPEDLSIARPWYPLRR